jgi:nicotinate phosphoribosyltransferase
METYGTQAHSWVMAHENETLAFRHFLDAFPDHAVLLLDTYDVHNALREILAMGRKPAGVRLDSGDLVKDSRWIRRELVRAGWNDVKIFASGDLDEDKMSALMKAGASIDAFGVGTALATPGDSPHLSLVYKLVEVERDGNVRGAAKLTTAKVTYPGAKQVFRFSDAAEKYSSDEIALSEEPERNAEPLLVQVMAGGKRVAKPGTTLQARERCLTSLARLPDRYRQLRRDVSYPVRYSTRLKALLETVKRRVHRAKSI